MGNDAQDWGEESEEPPTHTHEACVSQASGHLGTKGPRVKSSSQTLDCGADESQRPKAQNTYACVRIVQFTKHGRLINKDENALPLSDNDPLLWAK